MAFPVPLLCGNRIWYLWHCYFLGIWQEQSGPIRIQNAISSVTVWQTFLSVAFPCPITLQESYLISLQKSLWPPYFFWEHGQYHLTLHHITLSSDSVAVWQKVGPRLSLSHYSAGRQIAVEGTFLVCKIKPRLRFPQFYLSFYFVSHFSIRPPNQWHQNHQKPPSWGGGEENSNEAGQGESQVEPIYTI